MIYRLLACLVTMLAGPAVLAAGEAAGSQTYIWYDGGKPRQLWLDESLLAEFGARAETTGKPVAASAGVRIWRQQDQAAMQAKAHSRVSPVLRDTAGGRMRALPGNVIVRLDPAWSRSQVEAWLSVNGLKEVRRLPPGNNVIVVSAPPGLASLEMANRLQESGTVVSAQPDWWEHMELR